MIDHIHNQLRRDTALRRALLSDQDKKADVIAEYVAFRNRSQAPIVL